MNKEKYNILILNGSPRQENISSTYALCKSFIEGENTAGHKTEIFNVAKMNISGCRGCEYCHTKGHGNCIIKDDEVYIHDAIKRSDILILASPIYYFTFTAQLQAAIHRTYAMMIPPSIKGIGALLSSGSPGVYDFAIGQYRSALVDWYGVKDMGFVCHSGSNLQNSCNKAFKFGYDLSLE